ncbi:MAG TPA: FAD binding domain-containing protein [Phycisphaerae bacterium]|nr:FAD binding domain-containing protein [Phycisphaerae bacterium]
MRDHLVLYINGKVHEVRGGDVFVPLTTYLRERLGLVGTKIVCSEGDCGSCTVLIGRVRPGGGGGGGGEAGGIDYRPVCGCIQLMGQLDAVHVVTVEGLSDEGELNPVQREMVRCQGTQCGFCTPGFVVAMCGHLEEERRPTKQTWTRALTGNLCRCTGYASILEAGMAVDAGPGKWRRVGERYADAAIAQRLAAWERDAVEVCDGLARFAKPVDVRAAAAFRAAHPDCTVVSGGTDIGVQVNKRMRAITTLLSTAGLRDLEEVRVEAGAGSISTLIAGARASLTEVERAAAKALPEFARMLENFGSPLIRNAGTIGGNLANGSPIGDTMPAMFVLETEVELTGTNGSRRVNMNDFYTGYRQTVMQPGELVTAVRMRLPAAGELFQVYKISRRKDLDISSFTAAIWGRVSGGRIETMRIAYGGVGPVILRLRKTEAALTGAEFSEATFAAAGAVARSEIAPISDVRGAAAYRLQLAHNILGKFYAQTAALQRTGGRAATNGQGEHA